MLGEVLSRVRFYPCHNLRQDAFQQVLLNDSAGFGVKGVDYVSYVRSVPRTLSVVLTRFLRDCYVGLSVELGRVRSDERNTTGSCRFYDLTSIKPLKLTAGRIRTPSSASSNTTSVLGSSPRRSRRRLGIVTWPLELIRIFGCLPSRFLSYKFESSRPADRILGSSLDLRDADITTVIFFFARQRPS